MMFGGKGDAKGILARFSRTLSRDRKKKQSSKSQSGLASSPEGHETDDESTSPSVDAMADSFIDDSQLGSFDPKGHADITVRGARHDAALDMDFSYDETEAEPDEVCSSLLCFSQLIDANTETSVSQELQLILFW